MKMKGLVKAVQIVDDVCSARLVGGMVLQFQPLR